MKKFKFKSLICAVAALIFAVPMVTVPAFANSGPPWEEGVTPTGIHCVHENSVLEVQSETLTFNIGTPYYEMEEGEKYDTTVTAEYTFHNPTADVVNTKMAFPIGLMPNYEVDKNKLQPIENPITVNGQPAEYAVRHTCGTYNDFAEDVKKIKDDYIQTDFFKLDLPVTEYVFKTNLVGNTDALFKTKLPQSDKTRYICYADNQGNFSNYMQKDAEFSIYVLGEDIDLSSLDWSVTRYNEFLNRHTVVNGSVSLLKKTVPITFKEYALRGYDPNGKISEVDWYNGIFEYINKDGLCAGSDVSLFEGNFTEWYVYETSVEAGGTFTNAVTANLFPRIYYEYEPDVYQYSYYLSPAREWASFGNLTVNINTKLYLQSGEYYDPDEVVNKFTKTETGYTATFESLPDTEFYFRMCSVQTPSTRHVGTAFPTALVVLLLVSLIAVPVVCGVTLLIIFLVMRKKAKNKANEQAAVPPVDTPVQEVEASSDIDDGIAGEPAEAEEQPAEVEDQPAEAEEQSAVAVVEEASPAEEQAVAQTEEQPAPNEAKKEFCMYCGSPLEANTSFCVNCGAPVHNGRPVSPIHPAYTAPNQFGNRRVNGFGIAGFIVSLWAWIFIELLTGFALLLSAVAFGLSLTGLLLRKKYPRVYGLAIAGIVISSVMLVLVGVGVFLGLLAIISLII